MKRERHLASLEVLAVALDDATRVPVAVATHLADCGGCRADVEELRALRRLIRQGVADAPPGVVLRACALVPPPLPRRSELGRFQLARLLHDSSTAEVRHAVRGPAAARHQVWRAGAVDIDIAIEGPGLAAKPMLIGQLLPPRGLAAVTEGNVWLTEGGGRPQWAPISLSGEFCLPTPRRRRWGLCLEWGGIRARMRVS
jgi:hypothetical protein